MANRSPTFLHTELSSQARKRAVCSNHRDGAGEVSAPLQNRPLNLKSAAAACRDAFSPSDHPVLSASCPPEGPLLAHLLQHPLELSPAAPKPLRCPLYASKRVIRSVLKQRQKPLFQ